MAPLIRILLALALSTAVLASPHASRNVYSHAHRALVPRTPADVHAGAAALPLPKRKRSLNKRCIPRPSNSTTPAAPSSTAPMNVVPLPSSAPYSSAPSPSSAPPTDAPAPSTPTPTPTPTTSSSPPPAQTGSSSGSGGSSGLPSYLTGRQSGDGTWYSTGLGACGITNNDNQFIAAVSEHLFDAFPNYNGVNPNNNPVCNLQISVSYGGVSITVTVTDRCTGCSLTSLDLSPAAFSKLAPQSVGRIPITWEWVNLPSSL